MSTRLRGKDRLVGKNAVQMKNVMQLKKCARTSSGVSSCCQKPKRKHTTRRIYRFMIGTHVVCGVKASTSSTGSQNDAEVNYQFCPLSIALSGLAECKQPAA